MEEFTLEQTANLTGLDTELFNYAAKKDGKEINDKSSIRQLFDKIAKDKRISDIHFKVGTPPCLRLGDQIFPYTSSTIQYSNLDLTTMETLLNILLTNKQQKQFLETQEADCSSRTNEARFRINAGMELNGPYITARIIPNEIIDVSELGFPNEIWKEIIQLQQGLVLVTGITGSGKTTTLASLIQEINKNYAKKIICIEEPIEYVHKEIKSLIIQREVGIHTESFYNGVKYSLRQDPDIILVGEIRDYATAEAALQAVETGHLVFSTLHTQDSVGTIRRYIDFFREENKSEVRSSLAEFLSYVICQDLVPRAKGMERVLAMEVMKNNSAIRNLIREEKTEQIYSTMQTCAAENMITMESCLMNLYRTGKISKDAALKYARKKDYMRKEVEKTNQQ